jgi:alpha-tubulin suppressor-like RCC1 family protein
VPTGVVFESIDAGGYHTCGVRESDRRVLCWGDNEFGQANPGVSMIFDSLGAVNPPVEDAFASVSAGQSHTCGVRESDGSVVCWGAGYDQLRAPAGVAFAAVSAGGYHTCGIREVDRNVVCWGDETFPPLGMRFESVSAGETYTCGVTEGDRAIVCWSLIGRQPDE